MARITLKDIARRADVSVATVSMALRNHRRISKDTCERIQALAREMGYQADAALSALARYRSESSGAVAWEILGLVDNWPDRHSWAKQSNYQVLRETLRQTCREHGFTLEERWIGDVAEDACHPVFTEWYHRGVRGVFFAPPPPTETPVPIRLTLPGFHVVTFGPVWLYPDYPSVQSDYLENFRRTWEQLWNRGYRRIGLHLPESISWRTGHAWTSLYGFQESELLPPTHQIPICKVEISEGREAFLRWFRKWKPEVVVSFADWDSAVLREAGFAVPEQVACANLAAVPGKVSGMVPRPDALAVSAFKLMRTCLYESSHTRTPGIPLNVYVPGAWQEGSTLRPLV